LTHIKFDAFENTIRRVVGSWIGENLIDSVGLSEPNAINMQSDTLSITADHTML
jgi:hypothetical protein